MAGLGRRVAPRLHLLARAAPRPAARPRRRRHPRRRGGRRLAVGRRDLRRPRRRVRAARGDGAALRGAAHALARAGATRRSRPRACPWRSDTVRYRPLLSVTVRDSPSPPAQLLAINYSGSAGELTFPYLVGLAFGAGHLGAMGHLVGGAMALTLAAVLPPAYVGLREVYCSSRGAGAGNQHPSRGVRV